MKNHTAQGFTPVGGGDSLRHNAFRLFKPSNYTLKSNSYYQINNKSITTKKLNFRDFFDYHYLLRSTGFTLAEVLITLGIIGIVAALTIPSIIKSYQMRSFEIAFKKQYSVLNNTINYIQLNNSLSECYVTLARVIYQGKPVDNYVGRNSDCVALKNELISNLKLTPINQYSKFTPQLKVKTDGGIFINGSVNYDRFVKNSTYYLMPDGAVVIFTNTATYNFNNNMISIDINGAKGPNKWGYDVFLLTLVSKNGMIRLSDEYASLSEKGGKLPRTILLNENKNNTNFKTYGKW